MTRAIAWSVVDRPAHLPQRDRLGEGPVWDAASGRLFWIDIVGRRVNRLAPETGAVDTWLLDRPVSAVVPCSDGVVMAALTDGLARLDLATGALTPFARPDPDAGNRSNECRVSPRGELWLGTMANNIGPAGEDLPIPGATGGLFRVRGDGGHAAVLGGVGIANTLCWSPQGDRLYFADSSLGVIWAFDHDPDSGELTRRRVFAEPDAAPGWPDGSAIDEEGCLWNARWGAGCVVRFTPAGAVERIVDLPVAQPTCPAFGGRDGATLYVTSARQGLAALADDSLDGALFALPAPVAGPPYPRFKLVLDGPGRAGL